MEHLNKNVNKKKIVIKKHVTVHYVHDAPWLGLCKLENEISKKAENHIFWFKNPYHDDHYEK